jgi:DNA polymerase-3 subunit gamma/tau
MKDGADARTQLDLVLVKAAEPAHDPSAKALLARIERLEGRAVVPAAAHDPAQPATAAGRTKVAVAATTAPEAEAAVAAVAVVESDELSLDTVAEVWPAVVESFESESPQLYAILQEARPTALSDRDLTIAWPETASLYKRQAEDPERREQIARSIREVTGASLRLAYELAGEHRRAEPSLTEDELVDRFKEEFGAVEEPKEES